MTNAPAPTGSESATIVADTYRIEKGVARGGFSTIYRARHVEMDRPIALKILKLDEEVEASALERFSREARLTCAINHPHVVTIYEFGQDDRGLLFLAMEWLAGMSLNAHLEEKGALEAEQVTEFGSQIARGLEAAHRRGVLHRDLKPSNIMLARLTTGERLAKVLDFGVAKNLDRSNDEQIQITHQGMFVGTPRYAAPEQIRGGELSRQTDIYGLGLVLWEAAVGKPAVPTLDFHECCAHHLSETPWKMPDVPELPSDFVAIVERCLCKNPDRRFDSCAEVADALDSCFCERHVPAADIDDRADDEIRWEQILFSILLVITTVALLVHATLQ